MQLHPSGEFETWDMVPKDGSGTDGSSFEGWTLNKALDYALDGSPELQSFLSDYKDRNILVSDAVYNISSEDLLGRNTTQWWNLTFSVVASNEEMWEYYQENGEPPEWRYRILVARSTETRISGQKVSTFISKDEGDDYHGRREWGLDDQSLGLNNQVLTVSAAERLFKLDDEVSANVFDGGKLMKDVTFYYGVGGVSQSTMPSLQLIEQIMGFKTPTFDNSYAVQSGTVWSDGATFSASVDANTGQLLFVTSIEGSQLSAIFGG